MARFSDEGLMTTASMPIVVRQTNPRRLHSSTTWQDPSLECFGQAALLLPFSVLSCLSSLLQNVVPTFVVVDRCLATRDDSNSHGVRPAELTFHAVRKVQGKVTDRRIIIPTQLL